MTIIIFILCLTTVFLLVIGIAMKSEQAIINDRVNALRLSLDEDIRKVVPELATPFFGRFVGPALRKLMVGLSKLMPTNTASIAEKLEQAGHPWHLQPLEFIGIKALSVIVCMLAGIGIVILLNEPPLQKTVILICAFIIGYAIPDFVLHSAIQDRYRLIRKALPNSLDLLVVCAEAGVGFDAAMAKYVARTEGPLAYEFNRVLQDIAIGRSRVDAMKSMASRAKLPELITFTAAIRQADMLGASIVQVLRVQADNMRVSRNLRTRENAAKLPVKLLFPLIFCIFPAIFAVLLGPAVIQIGKALGIMGK
ncbi:MAG: type II secretion system F family protein [bacterium]